MLITLLSWAVIVFVVYALGICGEKLVALIWGYSVRKASTRIMMGVVLATVYAQFWSLIGGVGMAAFMALFFFSCVVLYFERAAIIAQIRKMFDCCGSSSRAKLFSLAMCIAVILSVSFVASRSTELYDTHNYHAQAIRWVEQYGIVPGLGNLHSRFAYNSSFLVLQSLFSFFWLGGDSFHTMNGFMYVVFTLFCIFGFRISKVPGITLSDILRILFLSLLLRYGELRSLAAPNTDFLALSYAAFMFVSWADLNEERETSPIPYGLLCILGLFAVSVKLSCAILPFFTIGPLWRMVQTKKFRDIAAFVLVGLAVFAPFLIRNVIISGYILYPAPGLDLFNFDWEMPKSVILTDRLAMIINSRSPVASATLDHYVQPVTQWLPDWMQQLGMYYGILIGVSIVCSVLSLVYVFIKVTKKSVYVYDAIIPSVATAGFFFLLFTSPLPRYGRFWFYIVPVVVIYLLASHWISWTIFSQKMGKYFNIRLLLSFVSLFLLLYCLVRGVGDAKMGQPTHWVIPCDYDNTGATNSFVFIQGQKFYYSEYSKGTPPGSGLNGYAGFPGTQSLDTLQRIEMRGSTLKEGFRTNSANKNVSFDFLGVDINDEKARVLGIG